ncbi:hypothetical protein F5884DRAFT_786256 [Xylogone sp. PMI_703]|nr:hypothetical protein F5884DRAFT_786256 [Xylogone sp. PMI_703]
MYFSHAVAFAAIAVSSIAALPNPLSSNNEAFAAISALERRSSGHASAFTTKGCSGGTSFSWTNLGNGCVTLNVNGQALEMNSIVLNNGDVCSAIRFYSDANCKNQVDNVGPRSSGQCVERIESWHSFAIVW